MKNLNDIDDNEIRIIGNTDGERDNGKKNRVWLYVAVIAGIAVAIVSLVVALHSGKGDTDVLETPSPSQISTQDVSVSDIWLNNSDVNKGEGVIRRDTVVDGINCAVFTPINVTPELFVGKIDTIDEGIVFAAMAADVRRDNGKIVGAFVLNGEPLAWGLSKKGYCAIINGNMAIGVADNSPLFEQATEEGGFFFRQYPAVAKGQALCNNPENKAFRRALCGLNGDMVIVVSMDKVLMNEFSTMLQHMGVDNAIFLVGGSAQGWSVDMNGEKTWLGTDAFEKSDYMNYLIFRR